MPSPAENEAVVREALPKVVRRAINQTVISTAQMPGEPPVGEVEYYVGCSPDEVKRVDIALAALAALRAQAEAGEQAREALRLVLDCKGSYNGTVSERGGEPAICTKCEAIARAALPAREEGDPTNG